MNKFMWICLGIVIWGIPTNVMFAFFMSVVDFSNQSLRSFQMGAFLKYLGWGSPVFIIGGVIFGFYIRSVWQRHKKE